MRYKIVNGGYIEAVGIGNAGIEISQSEYDEIISVIAEKPIDTATVGHKLKTDLTWESYEKEPVPPYVDEPTTEELLDILMGESE